MPSTHYILETSQWFSAGRKTYARLNRHLTKQSLPTVSFHLLAALSAVISTLALLANSSASLIGAMIIAPLMGPIMGVAFGATAGDSKLLRHAAATLGIGSFSVFACSWGIASLLGFSQLSAEVLQRTNPTLIDLGIALAAGVAGALAQSRKGIDPSLAGVAIAVALVPPLSVVGIGLSLPILESKVSLGAGLLYLTNLAGMLLAAGIVFLIQGYGSWERARQSVFVIILSVVLIAFPLFFSFSQLVKRQNLQYQVRTLIAESDIFTQAQLERLQTHQTRHNLTVKMNLFSSEETPIQRSRLMDFQQELERTLNQPVNLETRLIPFRNYQFTSPKLLSEQRH